MPWVNLLKALENDMTSTPIQAPKATGSTRNQTIDLVKLILSVFVVAIHAELTLGLLTPILRCAVPIFFLFSGYFYFCKLSRCQSGAQRKTTLLSFVKRTLSLYAFWFVALLPITLYIRREEWFSSSVAEGFIAFFRDLFFSSTFRASWFLMALLLGVLIIHALSRVMSARLIVALTLPIYVLCCLFTNYFNLTEGLGALSEVSHGLLSVFPSFANSFPAALFWLALSNLFARGQLPALKPSLCCATGGLILLLMEGVLVSRFHLRAEDDCYLSLILLCPSVFCLVLRARPLNFPRLPLGAMSTIFYTFHASFISVLTFLFKLVLPSVQGPWLSLFLFFGALAACVLLSVVILYLERFRPLRFLKYSH